MVWDEQGLSAAIGTRASHRRAVKIMRLHEKAIPFLGTCGSFVVTGGADGSVRFYDAVLRLTAWFEELRAGPVAAVSFSTSGDARPAATTKLNRFFGPDFVVATSRGTLVSVTSSAFNEPDGSPRVLAGPLAASIASSGLSGSAGGAGGGSPLAGELLIETVCRDAVDVAAHPMRPELFVLGAAGTLQRWDLAASRCVASRQLPAECRGARTLAVARDASFVAVGFEGGHVVLVEADSLDEVANMRNSAHAIERWVELKLVFAVVLGSQRSIFIICCCFTHPTHPQSTQADRVFQRPAAGCLGRQRQRAADGAAALQVHLPP